MKRARQFKMLLSAEEHRALKWLAEQSCHTASNYLRAIITERFRDEREVPELRKLIESARASRKRAA